MIRLPRAFLSHSSADKGIVKEVAKILGRASVVYDEFEFSVGDEFKDAIVKGLAGSDIFVLFASRGALKRDWVKFEINSARQAVTYAGAQSGSYVYYRFRSRSCLYSRLDEVDVDRSAGECWFNSNPYTTAAQSAANREVTNLFRGATERN